MSPAEILESLRDEAREVLSRDLAESSLVNPSEDEEARAWSILLKLVEEENRKHALKGSEAIGEQQRTAVAQDLFNHFFRMGPLQGYLEEESVEEVVVNGHRRGFVIRDDGSKEQMDSGFGSDAEIRLLLTRVVSRAGRRIDESSPAVDVRLPDGSRLHAVLPPITESPCITIRRHRLRAHTLSDLVDLGTLTPEAATFLAAAVEAGLNILVSGGTGSGKTTTLNALGRAIPEEERIITIEETGELRLRDLLPDCVALEQRKSNTEGVGEISIRELVRQALRMRPNRIVVGEVRGSEALDMLSAMNTGHQGSMGTIHANSARQALSKLEIYMLSGGEPITPDLAAKIIAETINLVVHLKFVERTRRTVAQIAEVSGIEGGQVLIDDLFRLDQSALVRTGVRSRSLGHIEALSGMHADPSANGWRRWG
jgi:pilus assembly protein CpaF